MSRFRYEGENWEGRQFVVSDAIQALGEAVERTYIDRHPEDGTVASKNHDATSPSSDHRPRPLDASPGIVRAIDIGVYGDEGQAIAEAIRLGQDPRVRYVIHRKKIFASYFRPYRLAWRWGTYVGDPHTGHVHVSLLDTGDADDTLLKGVDDVTFTPQDVDDLKAELAAMRAKGSSPGWVGYAIQQIRDLRGIDFDALKALQASDLTLPDDVVRRGQSITIA